MQRAHIDDVVTAWSARDHDRALLPEDHAAIEATASARALIAELAISEAQADLFHACLVLGRLIAAHGGSPTLAAATIDGLTGALAQCGEGAASGRWVASARAAMAEGYDAVRMESTRRAAMAAWDFPRCAARVDKDTMAFTAGAPEDDEDALGDWAARVAVAALRAKVRYAFVDGPEKPKRTLVDALTLAGIEVRDHASHARDPSAKTEKKSALRLPSWLRRGER